VNGSRRAPALAAALAVAALGAGACGGSSDPGDGPRRDGPAAARPPAGGDAERVRAAFARVTRAFPHRPRAYCSGLTAAARRDVTLLTIPIGRTCVATLRDLVRRGRLVGEHERLRVVSVDVEGERARMALRDDGRVEHLPFRRGADGKWRLQRIDARPTPRRGPPPSAARLNVPAFDARSADSR
jgi:hypothetical protein